jgi:AraC-like DNA-binding protein
MRTVEQYWLDFEKYGFIKEQISGGYRYRIPPHLGEGGFELWGDITCCMACISDIVFYKPCVILEGVHEKMLEFGQFYSGEVSFYQKKSTVYPFDYGLNYLVTPPFLYGYKRMEPHQRLLNIGIAYREKFFDTLPYTLPEDFWETAAAVLNPDVVHLPSVSAICDQLRNCRLTGMALEIFVQGKCLEAFGLTLDYIYANKKSSAVNLTAKDRSALEQVKAMLGSNPQEPPSIKEMSVAIGMNQKKMMAGFKQINGITIYTFLKRIRMEKALELLLENELSMLDIARAVGYRGDGHFQQAFKDVYGTTPGKMRKELATYSAMA